MKETTRLEWLFEELDRLCEVYADRPDAIDALEAVRFWAIEESVLEGPTQEEIDLMRQGLGEKKTYHERTACR